MEAKESPLCTTYWDLLALNARAGSNSVALAGLAQSNAGNKTQRYLPHLIRCRLSRFDCPRLSLATWTTRSSKSLRRGSFIALEFSSLGEVTSSWSAFWV